MRLGFAAMLSSLTLVACSLGSPSTEPEPNEAATSLPVPTASSSAAGEPEPPWADEEESRRRAEAYKEEKCLGNRPTLVGTPGDDRIRATDHLDVIMTLGGNDVIVGTRGGVLGDRFCTGTGDDRL